MRARLFSMLDRRRDWFIPAVGLLLIWILAARAPLDSDIWWHLRAGQETAANGQPLLADTFSFTRLGQPWINHSWLSQVLLYALFANLGYLGLGLWVVLGAVLSMAFIYPQLAGRPIGRVFILILGSSVAALVWSPRPQLVSLVLFGFTGWLLHQYKYQKVNRLWLLPLLFGLWGNLHGGYPLGLMLSGCMVGGEILNHVLRIARPERLEWRRIGVLTVWLGLSGLALLANPNGFDIWKIPFQTVGVGSLQSFIQEWASPNFHELTSQPFLWLLFGTAAALALAGRRADGTDLMALILFGAWGLTAQRNFGPFALAAMPVLSRGLAQAFAAWHGGEKAPPPGEAGAGAEARPPRPRWQRRVNLVVVGLLALVGFVKLGITANPVLMNNLVAEGNPAAAAAWLKEQRPAGRMLSEYNWGGYLAWNLPEYPVFVDGRTDLFGDEIIGEWLTVVQAGSGWREIVQKWQIGLVLVDPGRPIGPVLEKDGWQVLYRDSLAVLYGAPGGKVP